MWISLNKNGKNVDRLVFNWRRMTQTEMDDRNLMIENLTGHARAKKEDLMMCTGRTVFMKVLIPWIIRYLEFQKIQMINKKGVRARWYQTHTESKSEFWYVGIERVKGRGDRELECQVYSLIQRSSL